MYELERKVRASHSDVRARLERCGATPTETVVQEDIYWNHPSRNFVDTDEALRTRRQYEPDHEADGVVRFTYKGPRVDTDTKTRIEREVGVTDGSQLRSMLEALGFEAAGTVRKHRSLFVEGDINICLDEVDGIGEFVELETHAPPGDLETARSAVDALAGELGLADAESVTSSYLELVLEQ